MRVLSVLLHIAAGILFGLAVAKAWEYLQDWGSIMHEANQLNA